MAEPADRRNRSLSWRLQGIALLVFLLSFALSAGASDFRLELVRESLTAVHCRYREFVEGLPTDVWRTLPCEPGIQRNRIIENGISPEGLRHLEGRRVRRVIVEEKPLQPFIHDYDAATGELIRRLPFFHRSRVARVFDPNPVVALNDPSLQNQNDAREAVPFAAYRDVELQDVAASGPLRGPYAMLIDRQLPAVAPPDASGSLLFDRSESGFEDVNAYFHVDRNQRHLQSLGYTGSRSVASYPIEIDAHAASGSDNSFFIPYAARPGYGTLFFGTGGTDDAEDADLIIHEYLHAILEWISPGTFGGTFASQSRALGEGYGDYWAYSAHRAARAASGRDLFCIADWDARCWMDSAESQCAYPPNSDCLRRVDSPKTMLDYEAGDTAGVEHGNGAIWSSALRDMRERLTARYGEREGRRIADTLVIESVFGSPPQPSFEVMARRLIETDRLLTGGRNRADICAAMTARRILGRCDALPRGELTTFQSSQRRTSIPDQNPDGLVSLLTVNDPRIIERLFVRVDIEHPFRGDLRIELVAPDGTVVLLQPLSLDRASDVRVTYGLTATPAESLDILRGRSAAGVWKLVVRDLRLFDAGTLISWGLQIQFAGDEPVAARPAGRGVMIPVVTNVIGSGGRRYLSDVRISNLAPAPVTATLIFTPSGEDGRTSFASIDLALGVRETVTFENLLDAAFHTSGSGSLEIRGAVRVMSRIYVEDARGTLGQEVAVAREIAKAPERLLMAGLPEEGSRFNAGVTEIAGVEGVVRVTVGDETTELTIPPFSHLQIPVASATVSVEVLTPGSEIAAYLSQISASGDMMFIPAVRSASAVSRGPVLAPAISAAGAMGRSWISDLWTQHSDSQQAARFRYVTGGQQAGPIQPEPVVIDVVGAGFGQPGTSGTIEGLDMEVAHTRIRHGETTQYVPFLSRQSGAERLLVFIENAGPWRTNVGIATLSGAVAELIVYDAGGNELERRTLATIGGIAQVPLGAEVSGGRVLVRFLAGEGRAFASVIDTRSGDAAYVPDE